MTVPARHRRRWILPLLFGVAGSVITSVLTLIATGTDWAGIAGVTGAVIAALAGIGMDRGLERRSQLREEEHAEEKAADNARAGFIATGELPSQPLTAHSLAGLLRPEAGVVPFTGRNTERTRLVHWCIETDDEVSMLLLTGAGGVGKTRLALETIEELPRPQWTSRIVAAGQEVEALNAAAEAGGCLLLVVDYAEIRGVLPEMVTEIAKIKAGRFAGRLRVLLVAREAGEWWERLGAGAPAVRDLVEQTAVVPLVARLDDRREDADIVREALPHFARLFHLEPPVVTVTVTAGPDAPRLPVLVLHATALVAVLDQHAGKPGAQRVAEMGVLGRLIGHESRLWLGAAERLGLGLDLAVLKQIIAVMALFGVTDRHQAHDVLARVPDLEGLDGVWRGRLVRWLHELYPGRDGVGLESLRPDLVAERHVTDQLTAFPALRRNCLTGLGAADAAQALTVLTRAITHHERASGIIAEALEADLPNLAVPAIEVAIQSGSIMGDLLANALDHAPAGLENLEVIADAVPNPTVVLARANVVVTRRVRALLPTDSAPADLAAWNTRLALALFQVGDSEEALAMIEEAVAIHRKLAEKDPDLFLPALASSLNNQSNRLTELKRPKEALDAIKEAVAAYRSLAKTCPGRFLPGLANSLNNQSAHLAELGRLKEALVTVEEAVAIRRELAEKHPDQFLADLAESLVLNGLLLTDEDITEEAICLLLEGLRIAANEGIGSLVFAIVGKLQSVYENSPEEVRQILSDLAMSELSELLGH